MRGGDTVPLALHRAHPKASSSGDRAYTSSSGLPPLLPPTCHSCGEEITNTAGYASVSSFVSHQRGICWKRHAAGLQANTSIPFQIVSSFSALLFASALIPQLYCAWCKANSTLSKACELACKSKACIIVLSVALHVAVLSIINAALTFAVKNLYQVQVTCCVHV